MVHVDSRPTSPNKLKSSKLSHMRERIKELTKDYLIRDGYAGFRFQDLASELNVTRASIHYHFSSKQKLCEEVILEAVDKSIEMYRSMLRDGEFTYSERVRSIMNINRQRYLHYNPTGVTANPWALISRMRLEQHELSPMIRQKLAQFRTELQVNIEESLKHAIARNELRADTPIHVVALLLISIINSSDPTTRDTSSFDAMERLYLGYIDVVNAGYSSH